MTDTAEIYAAEVWREFRRTEGIDDLAAELWDDGRGSYRGEKLLDAASALVIRSVELGAEDRDGPERRAIKRLVSTPALRQALTGQLRPVRARLERLLSRWESEEP